MHASYSGCKSLGPGLCTENNMNIGLFTFLYNAFIPLFIDSRWGDVLVYKRFNTRLSCMHDKYIHILSTQMKTVKLQTAWDLNCKEDTKNNPSMRDVCKTFLCEMPQGKFMVLKKALCYGQLYSGSEGSFQLHWMLDKTGCKSIKRLKLQHIQTKMTLKWIQWLKEITLCLRYSYVACLTARNVQTF